MRSLRLGIDLDGVVADFNAGWINRYNRDFETQLAPEDVRHWDGVVDLTHFADIEEFWGWAKGKGKLGRDVDGPGDQVELAEAGSPSIFRDLPAYPDAVPTLRTLAAEHDIVIVTSKYDWAIADTLEWLAEHQVPTREIHFTWDKPTVACDVYLEDAPHNLEAYAQRRPQALICRFVRRWNAAVPGTVDVHSWAEFARLVRDHAKVDTPANSGRTHG